MDDPQIKRNHRAAAISSGRDIDATQLTGFLSLARHDRRQFRATRALLMPSGSCSAPLGAEHEPRAIFLQLDC